MRRCLLFIEQTRTLSDLRCYALYDEHIPNTHRTAESNESFVNIIRMVRVGAQVHEGKVVIGTALPAPQVAMYKDLSTRQFDEATGVFIDPRFTNMVARLNNLRTIFETGKSADGKDSAVKVDSPQLPKFMVTIKDGSFPPYCRDSVNSVVRDIVNRRVSIPDEILQLNSLHSGKIYVSESNGIVTVMVDEHEYKYSENMHIMVKDGDEVKIGDQLAEVYPLTHFADFSSMIETLGIPLYHELADIAVGILASENNGKVSYPLDILKLEELDPSNYTISLDFTDVPVYQFFEIKSYSDLKFSTRNLVFDIFNNPHREEKERVLKSRVNRRKFTPRQPRKVNLTVVMPPVETNEAIKDKTQNVEEPVII